MSIKITFNARLIKIVWKNLKPNAGNSYRNDRSTFLTFEVLIGLPKILKLYRIKVCLLIFFNTQDKLTMTKY